MLSYHGVVSDRSRAADEYLTRNLHTLADFRAHVALLRRTRRVVPPDAVASGDAPSRAVAITFDDGYASTALAAEVLDAAGLPFAVFVPTAVIGTDRSIWTVEESLLLLHGRASSVEIMGERWSLADRPSRQAALAGVRHRLKELPAADRRRELAAIEAQFPPDEVARLLQEFPDFQMLSWAGLGEVVRAGGTVGGHGEHHEIQHAAQPADVLAAEAEGSARTIRERLGKAPELFAYPDGGHDPARSPDALRRAGYRAAFVTGRSSVPAGADPMALPRHDPRSDLVSFAHDLWWEAS